MRAVKVHWPPPAPPPLRRLRHSRVLFFLSGVLICSIYSLTLKARVPTPGASSKTANADDVMKVKVREVIELNKTQGHVVLPEGSNPGLALKVNRTGLKQCIYLEPQPFKPPPTAALAPTLRPQQPPERKGEYPHDFFSVADRQQGWVALHITGMAYMFVALAIVCDEFFVPALEVIIVKLDISDDVAGATFMAAGGSAPELFTSLIGVFIAHSNVGIGTIVGSAVFNILFVIGMCAIFSREILHLTWWPLFRDVTFYILDLFMLIVFFLDNTMLWWESLLLVMGYFSYVSFMKFNRQIEKMVKTQINKHMSVIKVWSIEEPEKESDAPPLPPPAAPPPSAAAASSGAPNAAENSKPEPPACSPEHSKHPSDERDNRIKPKPVHSVLQRGSSSASLHNTALRNTIFQLMIHTLDPLGEERPLNGEVRGQGSGKKTAKNKVKPLNFADRLESQHHYSKDDDQKQKSEQGSADAASPPGGDTAEPCTSHPPHTENRSEGAAAGSSDRSNSSANDKHSSDYSESEDSSDDDDKDGKKESLVKEVEEEEEEEEEEHNEPLSLKWPETPRRQITYLLLLPIVLPLWLTVPDVRNLASRRYFAMTFVGSILWIGFFSYLMVWWAHQVGETMGISEEIMGLTILAAGTSIPDLITSVIVARKGLGDMAVSSSVGSNIFDITVGLPMPWLFYSLFNGGHPVTVSSNGLFCAIVLLFLMLLFVIFSIAMCRWKMSRTLGLTMFGMYFVFLVLAVMLENRILICPIST
ncbi:sodium/potassium/calcium exchanger 1-like isoform X2 [Cynoglossus semilaevis]|uniref:Sodium/potassium/calcium exchanger 1 n=1 Tax=Cynoglossus semilaevis TaxID=244447 RepID=A0A3P8WU68_CYNSE|nr:sodium/potassium/calcium exchanger 1-like isoform X2 [Cynoglossus semilaevis]